MFYLYQKSNSTTPDQYIYKSMEDYFQSLSLPKINCQELTIPAKSSIIISPIYFQLYMILSRKSPPRPQLIKTTTLSSQPQKTNVDHLNSTSPHSHIQPQTFPQTKIVPRGSLKPMQFESPQTLQTIEVSIQDSICTIDLEKGYESLQQLNRMMRDSNIRKQTQLSIRLVIAKKMSDFNLKYQDLLTEALTEYQEFKANWI